MILYDIGGFNGDSALHFVADHRINKIKVYEPNRTFIKLWAAISKRYPQITFYNFAVSDRFGRIQYTQRPEDSPLGSTTNPDKKDWGQGEIIQVNCLDIADIVGEDRQDCWLKLDVEGQEFTILERLIETDKLKYVKKLFIEWHTSKLQGDYESRQDKILAELNNNNVEVVEW